MRNAPRNGLIAPESERFITACVDVIARTGATGWQLRHDDDEEPTIWIAVATYDDDRAEAAAATNPIRAGYRLVERLVDGGTCTHCGRPTVADENWQHPIAEVFPRLEPTMCWFVYDPELATFAQSCQAAT